MTIRLKNPGPRLCRAAAGCAKQHHEGAPANDCAKELQGADTIRRATAGVPHRLPGAEPNKAFICGKTELTLPSATRTTRSFHLEFKLSTSPSQSAHLTTTLRFPGAVAKALWLSP